MKFDWETADRIQCTRAERTEVVPLIDVIFHAAMKARREGLLALEDEIDQYPSPLLKIGLQLVVDGTDPEIIAGYLNARIISENSRGKKLLEQVITTVAVMSIQSGDNPHLILMKCFAFLGEDSEELQEDYVSNTLVESEQQTVDAYSAADGAVTSCFADTRKLLEYDDRSIQKVLREIDVTPLKSILHGAESAVRVKIIRNMSKRAATLMIMSDSDRDKIAGEDVVKVNVEKLFTIVDRLTEAGEIAAVE